MDDARLLTANEVADRLGLTVHQVYRRMRRGDLAYTTDGPHRSTYYVTADALQRYIDAGQRLSKPKRDQSMLSVPQVAAKLNYTDETVRRLCYDGKLAFTKGAGRNGHLRIPREALDAYLGENSMVI